MPVPTRSSATQTTSSRMPYNLRAPLLAAPWTGGPFVATPRNRWTWVVLMPVLVVLTMELLLQAGALVVRAGAREMPRNWITDNTRLLALGDSNTFGMFVAPEESYPAQLEARWNEAHPDRSVEVLNLAYPGMNSFRILANIDAMLEKFRPDAVLLTVGVNDILTPVEEIPDEADSALAPVVRAIRRHSRLFYLLHMFRQSRAEIESVEIERREIAWHDERSKRFGQIMEFKQANRDELGREVMTAAGEEFVVIKEGDAAKNVDSLGENLGRIQEIVRRHDAELYLLTYAASKQLYAVSNRATRLYASSNEVRLIDVAGELQRICPDTDECPELFFADLHPKAEGYRLVAEAVQRRLARDWKLAREGANAPPPLP